MNQNINRFLESLNALPRKKSKVCVITSADFLTLKEAKAETCKAGLNDWDEESVFVRVKTLVKLYGSLTKGGRDKLANTGMVGGWFVADIGDEDDDADGCFCSTPCHSSDVPTVAEYSEDLEHCSEQGVLFLY